MKPTRREFLAQGTGVLASFPLLAASGAPWRLFDPENENVVVLVELNGGNDGLNTVIPYEDDHYQRARSTLRFTKEQVLPLKHRTKSGPSVILGLNPALTGLHQLYEEGVLAVLQNVGYPTPDRSHFRSLDIWHTGSVDPEGVSTGWIGRATDAWRQDGATGTPALVLGQEKVPLAMIGNQGKAPCIRDLESFVLDLGPETSRELRRQTLQEIAEKRTAPTKPALSYLRQATRDAYQEVDFLQAALQKVPSPVEYPDSSLAEKLKLGAKCIAAGIRCKAIFVKQTGYDTHAFQAETHAQLLRDLDGALTAFQQELKHHGLDQKVVTLVTSEFGRRVKENGSRGTDHGAASVAFVVSGAVRGGVFGGSPDFENLQDGDLRHRIDFRSIYSTLLQKWLGLSSKGILQKDFELLPLF